MRNQINPDYPFLGLKSFVFFSLISIFSILTFGVDAREHQFYNLIYLEIFLNPEQFVGTPVEIILESELNRQLLLALGPALQNASVVILLTVASNSVILLLGFLIAKKYFTLQSALILITILGLVANSPIYGLVDPELMFTRGSLTVLFVLVSIYSYLNKRWLVAGLCGALSVLIHPLNGISAFFFFYSGLVFYQVREARFSDLRQTAFSLLPVLLVIAYTVASSRSDSLSSGSGPFQEWYLFSLLLEADDVAMFWTLREGGLVFLPLLLISFSISLENYRKLNGKPLREGAIHAFNLVQLPLVIGIVFFEALQIYGLEAPLLSEWFTSLQLRRGLWIPLVIGLIALYAALSKQHDDPNRRWLLGVALAAALDHTFASIVAVSLLISFSSHSKLTRMIGFLSIIWCFGLVITGIQDLTFVHTAKHAAIFTLTSALFIFVAKNRSIAQAVILTLIFHSSVIMANSLWSQKTFTDSLQTLQTGAPLSRLAKEEKKALSEINNLVHSEDGLILFAPSALGYGAQLVSSRPLFLSRWDNMQIFRRAYFLPLVKKLNALGLDTDSCGTQIVESLTGCFLGKVQDRIDRMTLPDITALNMTYPIGAVVRRTLIEGKIPDKTVGGLYIYRLPELRETGE